MVVMLGVFGCFVANDSVKTKNWVLLFSHRQFSHRMFEGRKIQSDSQQFHFILENRIHTNSLEKNQIFILFIMIYEPRAVKFDFGK